MISSRPPLMDVLRSPSPRFFEELFSRSRDPSPVLLDDGLGPRPGVLGDVCPDGLDVWLEFALGDAPLERVAVNAVDVPVIFAEVAELGWCSIAAVNTAHV